jgi:hypothetical protein
MTNKKFYLIAASAAMLFAACSSDDATTSAPVAQNAPEAVAFDTYVPNATRSGQTDVMTTTQLQTVGFGVFAYQTDNTSYSSSAKPNFMYNQKVTYGASAWTYSPLKYWPNETKNDNNSATSITTNEIDKLTFFAYAPYVTAEVATGAITTAAIADKNASGADVANVGITLLSNNSNSGDPKVSYQIAYTPSKSVDLLWGVAPSTSGLSYTGVNNEGVSIGAELPLIDLWKPAIDQKIKFLFKHALARLGLKVVAAVDQTVPGGTLKAEETKIVIKEIAITSATVKDKGILNLNNTTAGTALWTDDSGATLSLKLDNSGESEMVDALKYVTDAATSFANAGVKTSEQDVIKNNKYFMLIPTHASTTFTVAIKYVTITKDDNVQGGYTETENKIKKDVTITNFTNNKAYTLKLILGMTSVKLDAEVADWDLEAASEIDLPKNKE